MKREAFQILQCDKWQTLRIRVPGSFEQALQLAHRKFHEYRNGHNYKRLQIKAQPRYVMAPKAEGWDVSLLLPQEDQVPKPVDHELLLEEIPPRMIAMTHFKGPVSHHTFVKNLERLKHWAREQKLKISAPSRLVMPAPSRMCLIPSLHQVHLDLSL